MEVPKLEVKSELQLLACTTTTATAGSNARLQPTPKLTATPDIYLAEQGQGSNPYPMDTSRVRYC